MRNVYTAAAPDFKAVRITKFLDDDGVDVELGASLRRRHDRDLRSRLGTESRRVGSRIRRTIPTAASAPSGRRSTDGSGAWRLAVDHEHRARPAVGGGRGGARAVARRQARRVRARRPDLSRARPRAASRRRWTRPACRSSRSGDARAIPSWSPDGSKLAFVSTRDNHAFIGVYDMKTRKVDFLSPSVDFDGEPDVVAGWQADRVHSSARARRSASRRSRVSGGIGNPGGPAAAGRGGAARWRGRWRRLAAAAVAAAAVRGGAATTTRAARSRRPLSRGVPRRLHALVHGRRRRDRQGAGVLAQPAERPDVRQHQRDHVGRRPRRLHRAACRTTSGIATSRSASTNPQPEPVLLTTTDGLINDSVADRTFVTTALSRDGKTFYYCTNAKDIEKRHIWAVPTSGGTPKQISTDDGVEVSPTPLASGKQIGRAVLQREAAGVDRHRAGRRRRDEGRLPDAATKDFPQSAHVTPRDRHHARGRRFRDS